MSQDKKESAEAKNAIDKLTDSIAKKDEEIGTQKSALEEEKSKMSLLSIERNEAV